VRITKFSTVIKSDYSRGCANKTRFLSRPFVISNLLFRHKIICSHHSVFSWSSYCYINIYNNVRIIQGVRKFNRQTFRDCREHHKNNFFQINPVSETCHYRLRDVRKRSEPRNISKNIISKISFTKNCFKQKL